MAQNVSVAEAKGQLSDLIRRTATQGERFVIRRHGRPVGALISPQDLEKLEALEPVRPPMGGAATVGLFADAPDWEDIMDEVMRSRSTESGREVDLE
jgi:prevent-host-death family protein